MAVKTATINRNADGTWTIRVGKMVEHIDGFGKSKGEIFDAIKYALVSKEVPVSDVDLAELIHQNGG